MLVMYDSHNTLLSLKCWTSIHLCTSDTSLECLYLKRKKNNKIIFRILCFQSFYLKIRAPPKKMFWKPSEVFYNELKITKVTLSGGSDGKESACNAGDPGSIPGSGKSPRKGNGKPLQYSCLENSMHRWLYPWYSPWGHKESDPNEQPIHTHI